MGGDSLYIFYRNRFLYSSTTEYQYGVPGSCSARSTVCPLPTRDVIEALTSSIVRVNHHTTLGNTVASDSDSQRTVDDVRPWTAADCMACIKNTRLWGHLMSGSPQSLSVARGSGNMALHVGDVTVTAKGSNLPLDQDFARRFVSRCWWDVGLSESQTVNSVGASPYMDSVYDVVTQMCRLLPQCSDNVKAMGSEGAWSHFSGRHCEMAAHDSRGEAEHISAIVTGISKSDLEQYNALHSDVEPLMVGLVCREGRGQPPAYNAVRTLTTAERLAVVGNSEDLVVSIQGSFQESRSVSVLLLELELANGEPNCDAESSSMWKTLLSVVDFVHVTGKRSFITQLDILIAEVRGSLLHAAPQGGKSSEQNRTMPMQGYRRDPFCSFSDFARPQLFYTVVEAGAVSVRCSNRALSVEGLQAALLKLPEIGPAMRAPCCGRLGPLQWLLLAEDMWLSASCAEVGGVSATEHKVDFAVKAATCVFARVAEGLLLAMHTTKSHSQRPDDIGIRDCDSWPENNGNAALSDDSAAVSWLYTVSWALRVAHRAALCVLGVAAAPQIVWDHASAHYKLYMACENEAESVRERFHYYGVIPTVRSTKLMKMPASETKDSALQIERDEAFGCAAPTVHKNVCEKQRLSTVPSLSRCSVMHNSEDGGTESFGVFYPSDNKENPVVLPRTVEVTSSASSEFPHQRLPTRLPRSTGFLACTVAEENQSPAQLYDALLLMKKQCAQFHERCRRAEGELKRQQAVARESRRQRAVLGGRLREVSSCLQRLVMLCIEYEEAHEGYERRRVFRLNHSFPPHAADDTDAWCLGSSSSFTPRNELWSTVAPGDVSGPMIDGREDEIPLRLEASQKQLTRLMLRDTQRHLNVCRNIILSIYHEAHGALRKTNLSTADCSLSGGASADISSAYQCESELSTVIRSARSESSAKRGSRTTYAALNSAQSTLWSESAINKAISAFYRSQEADELAGVDYSEKTSAHHASAELSDSSETVGALYMEGNVSNVQARVQGEAEDKCSQTTQPMSDGLFSLLVPRLKQGVAIPDVPTSLQPKQKEVFGVLAALREQYAMLEQALASQQSTLLRTLERNEQGWRQRQEGRESVQKHAGATAVGVLEMSEALKRQQIEVDVWRQLYSETILTVMKGAQDIGMLRRGLFGGCTASRNCYSNELPNSGECKRHTGTCDPEGYVPPVRSCLGDVVDVCGAGASASQSGERMMCSHGCGAAPTNGSTSMCTCAMPQRQFLNADITIKEKIQSSVIETSKLQELCAILVNNLQRLGVMHAASFELWNDGVLERYKLLMKELAAVFNSTDYRVSLPVERHGCTLREPQCWDAVTKKEQGICARAGAGLELFQRCLYRVASAYCAFMDAANDAMIERDEFVFLSAVFMQSARPISDCPSEGPQQPLLPNKREQRKLDTPHWLVHDLKLKKWRIAELEEALRQQKEVCSSFRETIAYLHALLRAQRELGMPEAPSPPLISPEFGALCPTFADTLMSSGAKTAMSAGFYSTRSQREVSGYVLRHDGSICVGRQALAKNVSANEERGEAENKHPISHNRKVEDAGQPPLSECAPPRPLSWYLRSLSVIESKLTDHAAGL